MTLAVNTEATEQLDSVMESNMGLVVLLAKSFNPRGSDELDEFVQLGRIAMWKAIEKHDPSRAKLSTLIWHYVRWDILRYLKKQSRLEIQLDESVPIADNLKVDPSLWEYLPDCLTYNENSVIKLRLQGHTFVAIGHEMGYSRRWANNTFKAALKKINNANKTKTQSKIYK